VGWGACGGLWWVVVYVVDCGGLGWVGVHVVDCGACVGLARAIDMAPYMTVYLMISLPKIPYLHRMYSSFWPTLCMWGLVHFNHSGGVETLAAQHLVRQKEELASCDASCAAYYVHEKRSSRIEILAAQH